MPGHQLFLASSEALQHVLLPYLPASDLLRLGLTCKPLLSWVISTPPSLWQVTLQHNSQSRQLSKSLPCTVGQLQLCCITYQCLDSRATLMPEAAPLAA